MKKLKMFLLGFAILAVFSQFCCGVFSGRIKKLEKLKLGMSQAQVSQTLGSPNIIKSARKEASGKTTEAWTYLFKNPGCEKAKAYLFRFENNKLISWALEQPRLKRANKIKKTKNKLKT